MIRYIKIGTRTAIAFSFIGFAIALLGSFSIIQLSKMNDTTNTLTRHRMPALVTVAEMRTEALMMQVRITQVSDAKDDLAIQRLIREIDDLSKSYDNAEARMLSYSNTEQSKVLYNRVKRLKDDFIESLPRLFRLSVPESMESAIDYRTNVVAPKVRALREALQEYMIFQEERAEDDNKLAIETYEQSKQLLYVGLGLTLFAMSIIGYFYTRSLVNPLKYAVDMAKIIASGDFSQKFSDRGKDEAAEMLNALTQMQNELKNALSLISGSSQQLAATSEQLSAVNARSARAITQQSDEVTHAATAVSELTAAIDEVARSANAAKSTTEIVEDRAQQGKVKVLDSIETVDSLRKEIDSSTEGVVSLAGHIAKINSILSVIREIADQTNLLALNAAIEAARAGENGRGFAVVADEVRALAHRTQSSTKDIETMMETIRKETEATVENMKRSTSMAFSTLSVANAAGETFSEIVDLLSNVTEQNVTIASATEEQSSVAKEVDKNLTLIRDLSLQTSSGADETMASSQELANLAQQLNLLVQKFKF